MPRPWPTAIQVERQRLAGRVQLETSRTWAQTRADTERIVTPLAYAQTFTSRAQLSQHLSEVGITLLPPPSPGHAELFRHDATGLVFREKEVLGHGSLAAILVEATACGAVQRQAVGE